jgi:hypothetical protein
MEAHAVLSLGSLRPSSQHCGRRLRGNSAPAVRVNPTMVLALP